MAIPSHAIILATYNGAEHLPAQLSSLQEQAATRWRLYVRDDGSSDDTLGILRSAATADPRITILPSDGQRLGPSASFAKLLAHCQRVGESYVFPCDQDDVWYPNKTTSMLAALCDHEVRFGREMPVLIHSDLRVVEFDLRLLHPSFARRQRLPSMEKRTARQLLFQNRVTGCASLVNQALLKHALPMPKVVMHDWWLAQCAALFGAIIYLDEPTVAYRQHTANAVGSQLPLDTALQIARSPESWWRKYEENFLLGVRQLSALRARVRGTQIGVDADMLKAIDEVLDALTNRDYSRLERIRKIARLDVAPERVLQRLALFFKVLLIADPVAPNGRIRGDD
jgi:glycosyltransferase involved in cell wall biosynthesis